MRRILVVPVLGSAHRSQRRATARPARPFDGAATPRVSIFGPPIRPEKEGALRARPQETVMRFLSMVRVNENSGLVPSEKLMADMGRLIDEMTREGKLISTAGLRPTAEGTRVRLRAGKLSAVDGPFAETKEMVGGFAILEAASMREAVELTKRFLRVHGDEWDLECEVRQMQGPDCGADA